MRVSKLIFLLISIFFCFFLNNSNAQWSLKTSGINSSLYSVHFANNNLGFAVGETGIILKTTNGGNNWSVIPVGTSLSFYGVRFANANYGWVVGESGRIMRTSNGGVNWLTQVSGTNQTLRSVFFNNAETGWVVGDSVILNTTNSGMNWYMQTMDTMKSFYSVYFINSNTGWITGYRTLKTTNGGTDWVVKVNKTNGRSILFVNEYSGWVVGGSYKLNKSTDGGETWYSGLFNKEVESPPATYTCIYFINENTGWFTSSHSFGGRILMTTNNGLNWNTDYPTTRDRKLYGVFSMSSGVGWAVGENGTILKRDALTGIENIGSKIPSSYTLYQNHPNPFNPTTKIRFEIAAHSVGQTFLSVYNLLGREIATLVNEPLQPGTYEITFDGSNLSSGIYFYRLWTETFISTKKLVLLK
jgi:photosystem II stability/assembly factor-like uncharacterized protein